MSKQTQTKETTMTKTKTKTKAKTKAKVHAPTQTEAVLGTYEYIPAVLRRAIEGLEDHMNITNDVGEGRFLKLIDLMSLLAAGYDAWLKHDREDLFLACMSAFDSAVDIDKIDDEDMLRDLQNGVGWFAKPKLRSRPVFYRGESLHERA
jgi:hypothetical protein